MTLPAWITDQLYNQIKTVVETCEDYIFGSEGFGKKENSELIKLKGGLLLQEMIANMDKVVAGGGGPKLHMFSAVSFLQKISDSEFFLCSTTPRLLHFCELLKRKLVLLEVKVQISLQL